MSLLAASGVPLVANSVEYSLVARTPERELVDAAAALGFGMNTAALAHIGLTQMDVMQGMHARKARMHELADGYIAMPGGLGTFDELFETVTWGQTGAHEKPVGLFNVRNYYAPLLAAIDHAVQEGFIFQEHREALFSESDPDKLLDVMAKYEHPYQAVKRWLREE